MARITATMALAALLAAAGVPSVDAGCCSWDMAGRTCSGQCGADVNGVPPNCTAIAEGSEVCNTYCSDSRENCEDGCGGTYIIDGVPVDNCGIVTTPPPFAGCNGHSMPGEHCGETRCCANLGETCYEKDEWWSACKRECTPGIDPNDPPQYQTPWTCRELGPRNMTVEGRDCYDLKEAYNLRSCCNTSAYLSEPLCRMVKHGSKRGGCCSLHPR